MGNPRDASSNSCMAPCITQTANSYLTAQGSTLRASDKTGITFEEVLGFIESGYPVIVWSTIDLGDKGDAYATQLVNGREFSLYENSHTVVVYGFDRLANTVMVSDSLAGYITCDIKLIAQRYTELGSQAVVIS